MVQPSPDLQCLCVLRSPVVYERITSLVAKLYFRDFDACQKDVWCHSGLSPEISLCCIVTPKCSSNPLFEHTMKLSLFFHYQAPTNPHVDRNQRAPPDHVRVRKFLYYIAIFIRFLLPEDVVTNVLTVNMHLDIEFRSKRGMCDPKGAEKGTNSELQNASVRSDCSLFGCSKRNSNSTIKGRTAKTDIIFGITTICWPTP